MTLMDEYYERRGKKLLPDKKILFGILEDLKDRRGLRQEFDQIDDEIKEELLQAWLVVINGVLCE